MSLLERTRARYEALRGTARIGASKAARELGLPVTYTGLSRRAFEAIEEQWGGARRPETSWEWRQIDRKYGDIKRMDIAVWEDDRLVMVAIGTPNANALCVHFVEGDPRADCQFKGKRVPLALEAMVRYAQMCGLQEIRIQPANETLAVLYQAKYGFSLVTAKGQVPYYRLAV